MWRVKLLNVISFYLTLSMYLDGYCYQKIIKKDSRCRFFKLFFIFVWSGYPLNNYLLTKLFWNLQMQQGLSLPGLQFLRPLSFQVTDLPLPLLPRKQNYLYWDFKLGLILKISYHPLNNICLTISILVRIKGTVFTLFLLYWSKIIDGLITYR